MNSKYNALLRGISSVVLGLSSGIIVNQITPTVVELPAWFAWGIFIIIVLIWLLLELRNESIELGFQGWIRNQFVWYNDLPSQQRRNSILIFVVLLPFLIILLTVRVWSSPTCPTDRTCILIAQFIPEEDKVAQEFVDNVLQDIHNVLDANNTSHYAIRRSVAVASPEEARELARKEGALLIVWGQVFTELSKEQLLVNVNFQLTDLLGVGEAQGTRPYRAEPLFYDAIGEYCSDCLYLEASQRANIVAYAVTGLVDYVQGNPREANLAFISALYCAGEVVEESMVDLLQPICKPEVPSERWNPGLLYYYTGKTFILRGNYAQGIAYLRKASTINEQDPAAWIGIGTAYQSWDIPKEAEKALIQAKSLAEGLLVDAHSEDLATIYFDLGLIYELLGDATNAQKYYQEAIEQFANQDEFSEYVSLLGLARVQSQTERRQALERARTLEPTLPWAYLELARLPQQDYAEVDKLLQQAEKQVPNEAYTYITKAELCLNNPTNAPNCAGDAYDKALKLRPNSGWLHSKIGDFYLPTNPVLPHQSWIKAEKYYRRAATELRPQDPWVHERLAYVLFNQKEYSEAIEQYELAISLAYTNSVPSTVYCNLQLARLRLKNGDNSEELLNCNKTR